MIQRDEPRGIPEKSIPHGMIFDSLNDLGNAVSNVSERTKEIFKRLESVMTPLVPTKEAVAESNNTKTWPPMSLELMKLTGRLYETDQLLDSILNRLEI